MPFPQTNEDYKKIQESMDRFGDGRGLAKIFQETSGVADPQPENKDPWGDWATDKEQKSFWDMDFDGVFSYINNKDTTACLPGLDQLDKPEGDPCEAFCRRAKEARHKECQILRKRVQQFLKDKGCPSVVRATELQKKSRSKHRSKARSKSGTCSGCTQSSRSKSRSRRR